MGTLAIDLAGTYTYKDYLLWEDDGRWELIHGHAYSMTPAPSRRHQEISLELLRQFANFLIDKPCRVYGAPFDVRFAMADERDDEIRTVVQPDISVICDQAKLDERGCKGSPDLVVEIVSPATARKDVKEKFLLYEEGGVREYWIVDPEVRTVMVFTQTGALRFGRPEIYSEEEAVTVGILQGLTIDLRSVFRT